VAPRFSLIVPAHEEERYLPRLLDSVDRARAAYRGGPEAVEVVVADNASTDRTAEIARARGCRVARVEKRAIAAARSSASPTPTGGSTRAPSTRSSARSSREESSPARPA
jgi:glycosyltransferase involved in cell wall biosynthesis